MILQSKIQNNSSFRNRKTILTGGCLSENHIHSSTSCDNPKSEADFDKGFPVPHVGIIVEILRATSNLNVITSFSGEATLIFLLAEAVDFFGKS